jgi:hypothetical protein
MSFKSFPSNVLQVTASTITSLAAKVTLDKLNRNRKKNFFIWFSLLGYGLSVFIKSKDKQKHFNF